MRVLFFLAALMFSAPAWAANCVAVVFYDSAQPPPLDLTYRIVPWSGVGRLSATILLGHQVAAVHVYYDQFGVQGGPTSEDFSTNGLWSSWLGMQYIAPTVEEPREQLVVSKFDDDTSASQYQGSKTTYRAALDSSENVTVTFPPNSRGGASSNVLNGTDLPETRGDTVSFTVGSRADDLGTGEIRDFVRANGCP